MKRKISKNIAIAFVVGLLYFLFLVPMSRLFALLPGTQVRPASFIPPAAGIYFGLPAAIGVFIGNLLADLLNYGNISTAMLFGSLFNFFMAYLSYRLWYACDKKQLKEDLIIYDSRSLIKYVLIMLYSSFTAAIGVSYSMLIFAGVSPADSILQLFMNNFEFALILGVISLILLPKTKLKPQLPKPILKAKLCPWHLILLLLLPLIIFAAGFTSYPIFSALDAGLNLVLIAVSLGLASIFLPIHLPEKSDENEMLKSSIRLRIFIYFILAAMLTAFLLLLVFFIIYSRIESDTNTLWNMTYLAAGISLNLIMLISVLILRHMEKKITVPLYNLARAYQAEDKVKGNSNEMDIFSSAIDFYSVNIDGDENSSDEYKLYIGLHDKDAREQLVSMEEARDLLGQICLDYVQGYMAAETSGGWLDQQENKVRENTLAFTIYGATDEQIHGIADEAILALNQEAVLIVKNNRQHEFYSGPARSENAH
jgi:hypothetical protein